MIASWPPVHQTGLFSAMGTRDFSRVHGPTPDATEVACTLLYSSTPYAAFRLAADFFTCLLPCRLCRRASIMSTAGLLFGCSISVIFPPLRFWLMRRSTFLRYSS